MAIEGTRWPGRATAFKSGRTHTVAIFNMLFGVEKRARKRFAAD